MGRRRGDGQRKGQRDKKGSQHRLDGKGHRQFLSLGNHRDSPQPPAKRVRHPPQRGGCLTGQPKAGSLDRLFVAALVANIIGCGVVFGPGIVRKQLALSEIVSAEMTKSTILEGWGIHYTKRGWLYNVSGRGAVIVGYETSTRIGEAVMPSHYNFWHTTGTVGSFGATASAATALRGHHATNTLPWTLDGVGLLPATIGPYVVRALGEQASRRYFVTAERFSAERAHALGQLPCQRTYQHELAADPGADHLDRLCRRP